MAGYNSAKNVRKLCHGFLVNDKDLDQLRPFLEGIAALFEIPNHRPFKVALVDGGLCTYPEGGVG